MSQDYIDDLYEQSVVADTTLQNMEKNFLALKSAFSGTTTPSNTVAGMWWFDTTSNILKLRNETNNAWQSVWDFANNKPIIANLSDEITNTMCAAALKDPAAGTAGLRTLGTGATQAAPGNIDVTTYFNNTISSYTEEQSDKSLDWVQIFPLYEMVYIPTTATTINMLSDLRVDTSSPEYETYIRFYINGLGSNYGVTTVNNTWQNDISCTLDISSLSGKHKVEVWVKSQHDTFATYRVRNICIYWNN